MTIRVIKRPTRAKRHRLNERRRSVEENRAERAKHGEVLPPEAAKGPREKRQLIERGLG